MEIQGLNPYIRGGIIQYLEYQSVCPFVRIGPSAPFLASDCVPSPSGTKRVGGATLAGAGGEEAGGGDISDERKPVYAEYTIQCCAAFTKMRPYNKRLQDLKFLYSSLCRTGNLFMNSVSMYVLIKKLII